MFFSVKEAFRLISRAKASFVLSLLSLSISVILITASVALIQTSQFIQSKIKENVSINLFLQDNLATARIAEIKSELQKSKYIRSVNFINKEKAAEIFIKETGEDFRQLLDYNPLPASYTVTLKAEYFDKDSLHSIISLLSRIKGVEDVSFKDQFIYKLISLMDDIKKYIFIATAIIFFISLYVVYSTVRLIISAKFEELETMKLVGAKLSTIKFPIIINSLIVGILSGIVSLAIFILFISVIGDYISTLSFLGTSKYFYLLLILLTGPLLGLLVSIVTLRRLSLKI
jgi:cell division transport system permease protein